MKKSIIWMAVSCLIVAVLLLVSCTPVLTEEEEAAPPEKEEVVTEEEEVALPEEEVVTEEETAPPTPAPPLDTTPPSAITGLIAVNAYDGRINAWWDKTAATDFDHYNIYLNKAEMADVTGMKPAQQIKGIAACRYQVTRLEDGTEYYVAVTAVDKSGNEDVRVDSVSATPVPMPQGTTDPDISVDIYEPDRVWAGTTLFRDNHNLASPRIIEVNMLGEIIWEYLVPQNLGVAGDVELLPNNNILFTAREGVYEIDRSGKIVWQYLTSKIDHDADRLPNGNTIFVFGMNDQKSDAQVTEVNPKGEVVWRWYAKDYFGKPPYDSIYDEGWTHVNAVIRLPDGNTLISLRNFDLVVEVNPQGAVVRIIGEGILKGVHDPEVLPNGNILTASFQPHRVVEIDAKTGEIVWQFATVPQGIPGVRDADRLPNGNTLLTGLQKLAEVTAEGEIVWQLTLGVTLEAGRERGLGFYKAERITEQK